jgi:hypothetical protein
MYIHVCDCGNSKETDRGTLNLIWEQFTKICREIIALAKFDKVRAILMRICNKHFCPNIQHA